MIDSILILFFLTDFICFIPFEYNKKIKSLGSAFIFILLIVLIVFAATRPPEIDRDYAYYEQWFATGRENVEISFLWIEKIIKVFKGEFGIFLLVYAILGVSTKVIAIKQLSAFPLVCILVYLGNFYLLQELTQIRAGVASGFILLAIFFRTRSKIFYTILFLVLAIIFHYSAVTVLPVLLLNTKKINKKVYIIAIVVSYVFAASFINILGSIINYLPLFIQWKIKSYEYENGTVLNIFNAWQLLRIAIAFVLIYFAEKVNAYQKGFYLFLKTYILGVCSFALLSFNPVFSVRVSELFFISDLIVIPSLLYVIPNRVFSRVIVVLISFFFLYLHVYYLEIFSN